MKSVQLKFWASTWNGADPTRHNCQHVQVGKPTSVKTAPKVWGGSCCPDNNTSPCIAGVDRGLVSLVSTVQCPDQRVVGKPASQLDLSQSPSFVNASMAGGLAAGCPASPKNNACLYVCAKSLDSLNVSRRIQKPRPRPRPRPDWEGGRS